MAGRLSLEVIRADRRGRGEEGRGRMLRTGDRAGRCAMVLAGVGAMALSGCQAQSSIVPAHRDDPVVVVETASFGEVEIVGHIYGNALVRSGSRVTARPQAGTQDEVVESVVTGEATFTIGFTGELLRTFDENSTEVEADEVYTAMMAALPEGVTAADPAPAEDAPVYAVTRHTSESRGLRTMSDLAGRCGEFTLGAREEALADRELATSVGTTYDCGFGRRVALGPDPRAVFDALREGEIGVGLVQSADPVLHPEDIVALDDDEAAVLAQHLVPVFRKGSLSEDQLALVNRISGELTTEDVRELLLGVEFGSATPVALANYWLDEHGY
ncbi:glycine betaine ABC transporter substrate-binding protein [Dietzia maris]|uniref:glycine betaine ABC transporter substrate-binding protein n=1 Tax=Dietzia maris TaxID=37915 RepID=UPI00341D1D42